MNKNKKTLEQSENTKELKRSKKELKENTEMYIERQARTYLLFISIFTLLITLGFGILIGYTVAEKSTLTPDEKVIDTVTDENLGMEIDLIEKELSEKEISEVTNILYNTLEYIKNNNGYIQCRTGEGEDDYITYLFNKNNEAFMQNQNEITIFKNDGNSVMINEYVYETKDTDIITIAEKVLEAVVSEDKTENIEFKQIETRTNNLGAELNSTDDLGYKAYTVNINSYEEIERIYNSLGIEGYAESTVNELKELYGENVEPQLKYYFTISNDYEINEEENKYPDFTFSCRMIYNNEEYTQWSVEGYSLLNDWELSDKWYTSNFDNEEEIIEMLDELNSEITNMFKGYAEQYGLDVNDLIETTEVESETTEVETETTEVAE